MSEHQHSWTDMRLNLTDAEECVCGAVQEAPTRTRTLTEFLLARIAEDERGANLLDASLVRDGWLPSTITREKLLAECEAKRRIVEYCPSASEDGDAWDTAFWRVLQMLALPYAEHPDYREEWKP